jgi:hypothetical protein
VQEELATDVEFFEERRKEAFDKRKDGLAAQYGRTINTLTRRPLIELHANCNVLQKYGFPTDMVELRTAYSDEPMGSRLELSRDLSAAIYEYAPGAEIVAGGKLWTSGGVYRLPAGSWSASPTRFARSARPIGRATSMTSPRPARPAQLPQPVLPRPTPSRRRSHIPLAAGDCPVLVGVPA